MPLIESKLVDIEANLLMETEHAYRIDDGAHKVWVPKKIVENNKDGTWTMPEWLAKERELI